MCSHVSSQTIGSLNISPQNPTDQDHILLLAKSTFQSSDCDSSISSLSINGNDIYVYSIHCLGMLSAICYDKDTFDVGILPPGNYKFIFSLDQGFLPSCTPGIAPGPSDTLKFTVSPVTQTNEVFDKDAFSIYPNPTNGTLNFSNINNLTGSMLLLYSAQGELMAQKVIKNKFMSMSVECK